MSGVSREQPGTDSNSPAAALGPRPPPPLPLPKRQKLYPTAATLCWRARSQVSPCRRGEYYPVHKGGRLAPVGGVQVIPHRKDELAPYSRLLNLFPRVSVSLRGPRSSTGNLWPHAPLHLQSGNTQLSLESQPGPGSTLPGQPGGAAELGGGQRCEVCVRRQGEPQAQGGGSLTACRLQGKGN